MLTASLSPREARGSASIVWAGIAWRDIAYWLLVALPLGFLTFEIARWSRDVPHWDEFDTVLEFLIAIDSGASLRDVVDRLFAINNEHRMLVSRLLFAATYWIFGEVNFIAFAVIGNLFLVGAFAQLVVAVRDAAARLRLAAVFALVVFQLQHHESLFWAGSSIDHFFVVLAAVAALAALTRPGRGAVALACACGFLASFSLAHGLMVWPVGLALLAMQRRKAACVWWIAACVATLVPFFAGFHVNPGHAMPELKQLPLVFVFWLRLLGSTAAFDDVHVAPWMGAVLLVASGWVFRRGCSERERLACGAIAWCVGSLAMIAWGRALMWIEWSPLSSRYIVLSSVAWALLLWVVMERALAGQPVSRRSWWLPLGFGALVVFNIGANVSHLEVGRAFARQLETAVESYHRNGTFGRSTTIIYPHAERADQLIAEAQRRGLYRLPPIDALTLAQPTPLELDEPREIGDAVYFFDEVTELPGETVLRGWAFRPEHTTRYGSVSVVFRSAKGLYAFEAMPQLRPDVASAYKRWDATYSGFELRVPHSELPAGKLDVGICFANPGTDDEYMMTANTVVVKKS